MNDIDKILTTAQNLFIKNLDNQKTQDEIKLKQLEISQESSRSTSELAVKELEFERDSFFKKENNKRYYFTLSLIFAFIFLIGVVLISYFNKETGDKLLGYIFEVLKILAGGYVGYLIGKNKRKDK